MNKIPGAAAQHRMIIYAITFLFFLQLVTEFIEAVYVFGLLGTGIPNEIVSILFFFSPLIVVIFGSRLAGTGLVLLGEIVIVTRLVEPLLDTRGKMLVSGFGVACFLILLPLLLWRLSREGEHIPRRDLGLALMLSLALAVLLRAWNSGSDLSLQGWFQLIGWGLGTIAGALLPGAFRGGIQDDQPVQSPYCYSFARLAGLCVGVTAVFAMLYFALSSPNVIARWTGGNYIFILVTLALAMILFSVFITINPNSLTRLSKNVILVWNAVFVATLILTITPHQLSFPRDPSGYPFYEPPVSAVSSISLYVMLLLSPIVVVNFILYTNEVISIKPRIRQLGSGFLIASILLLFIALAHVFTTVYAYIPLIGPFFRDRFWLVYLVVGLAQGLPILLVSQSTTPGSRSRRPSYALLIAGIYTAAVVGALLISARPIQSSDPENTLRILTYNVQQGYSQAGLRNFNGQLELIRSVDPDIIGLQESDTNRIAGGNADLVRHFADQLDMYSFYGPKTVPGTFGIALLSKYPIQKARTFYMHSEDEQTATISAQIQAGEQTIKIFVTHLGNGGPIIQQEAILEEVNGLDNVIAMGDFNFRPNSEQYLLTTNQLEDAWLSKWPQGIDDHGFNPTDRIDHAFVSPEITIDDARYLTKPESDHPALMVDISW
jgi:endonuclease/exonuclease/phosphatase family metal-dependent hydrolase